MTYHQLQSGSTTLSFPPWGSRRVHTSIMTKAPTPFKTCFFYLRLRTALKACVVHWNVFQPPHPLVTLLYPKSLGKLVPSVTDWCWPSLFNNIFISSMNLAHKLHIFTQSISHASSWLPDEPFGFRGL